MSVIFGILKDYLIFINIIFACIIIFFERRKPVFTLFWIMILLLTSYFGFIMYLFFGMRFKKRIELKKYYLSTGKEHSKKIQSELESGLKKWTGLSSYLESVLLGKLTYNNDLKIFKTADEFFESLYNEIEKAKTEVFMEYYIFDDDEVGSPFYDLLLKKAAEGLDVRVIIDGAGTRGIKKERIKQLKSAGIKFKVFFPSYFPFIKTGNLRANYRDHRKITLIDNQICYSGGLNIGIDYVGKGRLGNWQDIGFSIEGVCVMDYLHEFERNWKFLKKDKTEKFESKMRTIKPHSLTPIQVISSGPNYEYHTIKDTFLNLVIKAEKNIYIETPYFIPDESILDALKLALLSGVKVKIIIPAVGDHPFVYWANQYFYGELIEIGAEIYKYKDGFIHSKLVLVDSEVACVGTANFDYRSMYQNFEISLLLFGEKTIELNERFEENIKKSKKVEITDFKARGKKEKIMESISKLMAPIL